MGFVPLVKPQPLFSAADADPPLETSHLIIVHDLGMHPLRPGFLLQGNLSHLLECSITFHTELEGLFTLLVTLQLAIVLAFYYCCNKLL